MNKQKLASMAALAVTTFAAHAQDTPQIRVVVDGEEMSFPNQQPVKTNGRVLVPLRGVFERLGAHVDWNPDTQTISALRRDTHISLVVGQLDASVNGRVVHLDVPPELINGSTMVPLRFVSEALGENVDWNSFQNEVDITKGMDYRIPRGDRDHGRTPPAIVDPAPRPHNPPAPRVDVEIPVDSVIPVRLDDRLTSYDAKPGDTFSATLMTDGDHRYMELPEGTLVYGHVSFSKRREGPNPGILELKFDRIKTPNGTIMPVSGQLIGLDSASVDHVSNGAMVAKSSVRAERVVYTGYGPGVGVLVKVHDNHAVADVSLRDWIGHRVSQEIQHRQTSDVELVPGTQFGIRLNKPVYFRRGVR